MAIMRHGVAIASLNRMRHPPLEFLVTETLSHYNSLVYSNTTSDPQGGSCFSTSVQERFVPSDRSDSPQPRPLRRIFGVSAALLIVVAALVVVVTVPVWTRWLAMRQADIGAISEGQRWLGWSAWFSSGNSTTQLMEAVCFRRLGQMDRWQAALESARTNGADAHRLQQEHALGMIRLGAEAPPEKYWKDPAAAGLRPYDAVEVCVRGHLARNDPVKAQEILDFWAAALPEDAHVAYLEGVYWFNQGDEAKALAKFEDAVTRQPSHELAHTAVARLLEKQDRLAEALTAYVRFASACPHSETAVMEMAGVLRELGWIEEARDVAESFDSSADPSLEFRVEMGSIELELGKYPKALRWFGQASAAQGKKKRDLQRDAATAFALAEEPAIADRLFQQADAAEDAETRASELLAQLAVAPDRSDAADELERLSAAATEAAAQSPSIQAEHSRLAMRDNTKLTAADLYALHCAACHGNDGGGDGRAARHQFPAPRNLRSDDFRLVSTDNANPTMEDLKQVTRRGMPGTSMGAFDQLSENQVQLLAEEVRRLRREGLRDWYLALLRAEEEEIDEEDVREVVDLRSLPGNVLQVPAIGPGDLAAVAGGKTLYLQNGCRPCHGEDGAGGSDVALFDEQGLPDWPRDLVSDPFKGGHEPESIYLRILAGMPGSAHPATKALTEEQYVDLVHYCGSLSRQPKRTRTNHQRFLEATQRALTSAIAEATDENAPGAAPEN